MTRRRLRAATARVIRAGTFTLVVSLLLHISIAHAIDVLPPGGTSEARLTLDMSLDSSTLRASSLDVNVTLAPYGGIYDSGFRLRLSVGRSRYEYLANDSPRSMGSGHGHEIDILVGYGVSMPRVSLIGLVGVASSASEDEGVRRRSGRRAKGVVSVYANPSDDTMVYASFSHSAFQSVSQLQAKIGAKLAGDFFVGPETNLTWRRGNPWDTHVAIGRIGMHLSSVKVGPWYLSVSGGWLRDHDLGSGHYLSLGVYGGF